MLVLLLVCWCAGVLVFSVGTFSKGTTRRHIMGKLTATGVNKSKSESKVYRVSDGGGLFLEVRPNSSKYWRYNYRFFKKKDTRYWRIPCCFTRKGS